MSSPLYGKLNLKVIVIAVLFFIVILSCHEKAYSQSDNRYSPIDTTAIANRQPLQKKIPSKALLRSLILPGWGQVYNEQNLKAVLVFVAEVGLIGTSIYWDQLASEQPDQSDTQFLYQDYRNTSLWFLAGTVLLSMLDAYVDAYLFDFDEGPLQVNSQAYHRESIEPQRPIFKLGVGIKF